VLTNIAFVVPGIPQGKARARSTASGRHYTPKKTADYESSIGWCAKVAMGANEPLQGPLLVEIDAYSVPPLSWSKRKRDDALNGRVLPTVKPDIDNICKAVFDGAFNGIVAQDDKQIVVLAANKRYGCTAEIRVRVAAIPAIG
jgi:Holliday junction resolvase RusA-like endonuclease